MSLFRRKNRNTTKQIAGHVPGMIEPLEQQLLFQLAKEANLTENSCIIEFGSFLGKSAYCLASGLSEGNRNKLPERSNPAIRCYDSFECATEGAFYPHLLSHAKDANVEHLIERNGQRISFKGIFDHYINNFPPMTACAFQAELTKMAHLDECEIKIMHLDLPKWYSDSFHTSIPTELRRTLRSKTFQGFADAIASQWSNL